LASSSAIVGTRAMVQWPGQPVAVVLDLAQPEPRPATKSVRTRLFAGECAFIPRGVAHAWKNTSTETGRALFMYTPAQAGKLFEDSRLLQRPLSLMSEHEITELFQIHRWEIVGPSPF
jgi:oxalate decarboxylase/phosphoglucose isomerase-like protein (cupin superfamily)